jgi:hypothetical protein
MKMKYLILFLGLVLSLSFACTRRVLIVKKAPGYGLPPGQAKKINGSQSAKAYAPGQQKKKW